MKNKKKRIENHQYLKSHVRSILYWLGKFSSFMLLLLACLLAYSLALFFSVSQSQAEFFFFIFHFSIFIIAPSIWDMTSKIVDKILILLQYNSRYIDWMNEWMNGISQGWQEGGGLNFFSFSLLEHCNGMSMVMEKHKVQAIQHPPTHSLICEWNERRASPQSECWAIFMNNCLEDDDEKHSSASFSSD